MGKKKKKRTKKYRPTYTTGGRVDMRTGGRVKAQRGGVQEKPQKPISTPDEKPVTGGPVGPGVPFDPPDDDDNGGKEDPPNNPPQTPITQGEGQAFNAGRGTISSQARRERIARTEAETEARAAGQVPEAAVIPDVSQEAGTAVDEDIKQGTTTMAEPTTVTGKTAEQVTPETVTEGQLDTATQPTERSAAQISADELTTVSEEVTVKAAQGNRDAVVKANLEEIRNLTEPAKFAKIEKSVAEAEKADNVEAVLQSKIYDKDVRGSKVNLV
jgi:hypothetical protein